MTGPTIASPLDPDTITPRYDPAFTSPLVKTATPAASISRNLAANAYSATALMGLAASALEQPGEDPATPSDDGPSLTRPTTGSNPRAGTQALPNLRVSTNMSAINNGDKISASSATTGKATDSAVFTPRANTNNLLASAGAGQSRPAGVPDKLRPNNGYAGKRPKMREAMLSQPEMSELSETEKEIRAQKVRDIIKDQFSLEILLKHRELQDIEAEIGKAEACLEQIRRCSIEASMERDGCFNDTGGVIMTYSPAPSVLNGPYSRQYREWLMEDRVNSAAPRYHDVLAKDQSLNFVVGRRNARPDPASQSTRPQREVAQQSQKKPSVCLHRQADGSLLKLTCLDCHRSDFGSAQGFINHCRLAHHREFVNHDAAAAACGSPFDPTGYDGTLPAPRSARGLKNTGNVSHAKAGRKNAETKKTAKAAKASKANKKKHGVSMTPSAIPNMSQTGPLTPPLQAEEMSLPRTIQTSHLKDYLSMKQMDVDNLDMMVEEAVNRVGMVEESEGEDEDVVNTVEKVENTISLTQVEKATELEKLEETVGTLETAEVTSNDPTSVDAPTHAEDVSMIDITNDTPAATEPEEPAVSAPITFDEVSEKQPADSAYEASEELSDAIAASTIAEKTTLDEPIHLEDGEEKQDEEEEEEEEQPRPVSSSSRRSAMTTRSSPRTPVAPAATRMSTRAHPLPTMEMPSTRHSARLAEVGKPSPSPAKPLKRV